MSIKIKKKKGSYICDSAPTEFDWTRGHMALDQ